MRKLKLFVADTSGATALEYAVLAAGISLAIIGTVNALGLTISNEFNLISTSLR
jgi:pilus assembly protein Flp/PilA